MGSLEVEPYVVSHLSRITCLANQRARAAGAGELTDASGTQLRSIFSCIRFMQVEQTDAQQRGHLLGLGALCRLFGKTFCMAASGRCDRLLYKRCSSPTA